MTIYKIKAGRVPNINFDTGFVGIKDTLFYDSLTGDLRISDGITPGGVPITLNDIIINIRQLSDLKIPGGTNGQVLSTDGNGTLSWVSGGGGGGDGYTGSRGYTGSAGSAGLSTSYFNYIIDTGSTSGMPASGHIRYNNATQINATYINVKHLTEEGLDIDIFLALLGNTQQIIIQDRADSNNFQTWTISGTPTDVNSGGPFSYWQFPVTLVTSGGTGTTGFSSELPVILAITQGRVGYTGSVGASGYTGSIGYTGSSSTNIAPSVAPAPPASGWTFFVDSDDGDKLKAIASNGTIVTLGTP